MPASSTPPWQAIASLVLLGVGGVLVQSSAATSPSQVHRVFPPADIEIQDLASYVAGRLDLVPDFVLASSTTGDATSISSHAGAAAAYNITLQTSRPDGNFDPVQSLTQLVDRENGSLRYVRPEHVHAGIDLAGMLTITAPPGRFPQDAGGPPHQNLLDLALRLGLPPGNLSDWNITPYSSTSGPNPINFYSTALHIPFNFILDCSDCIAAVRRADIRDTVNVNFAMASLSADGSVIALQTSDWVDLKDPRLMSLDIGAESARDSLEKLGYHVTNLTFQGHALATDLRLVDKWNAQLGPGSKDDWTSAGIETDAITGDIVNGPWTTFAHTASPPPARPSEQVGASPARTVPASGLAAMIAATTGVAGLMQRRKA